MVKKFRAILWRYPGMSGWHFVTLPVRLSNQIKKQFKTKAGPWGALKIKATVGKSGWSTSLFPDTKRQAYLLPVKALIRKKEGLENGDKVTVTIELPSLD